MAENSLRVVARIVANPDSVDRVRSILSGIVEPTRGESGCISYELLQNQSDPTDFTFVEEWRDEAAIAAHMSTEHVQNALSKLAGLLASEPDISKYSVVK